MRRKGDPRLSARQQEEIAEHYAKCPRTTPGGKIKYGYADALARMYGISRSRISQIGSRVLTKTALGLAETPDLSGTISQVATDGAA